jgi:hypothetical protein
VAGITLIFPQAVRESGRRQRLEDWRNQAAEMAIFDRKNHTKGTAER